MAPGRYLYSHLLILTLIYGYIDAQCCTDGWMPHGGSCYLFAHNKLSFTEAEHFCQNHGAHLVHIDTAQENSFLKSFVNDLKDADHWIGLSDVIFEGEWKWSDTDTVPEYTDWLPGQPNAGKSANCVALVTGYNYFWADRACAYSYHPICEKSPGVDGGIIG